MKKFLSILTLGLFFAFPANSQTVIFQDDFEAFTANDFVSVSDYWTTWSNNTGGTDDARISSVQNHTTEGVNALKIVSEDDIVGYFGDKSSGAYTVNFYMFVETNKGGHFNIEHVFGSNWAFGVNFKNNGTGTLNYNNGTVQNFTYTQNSWLYVSMLFDLDSDEATLWIDEAQIAQWQFSTAESGTAISNILDCIDFYGHSSTGQNSSYFVDDFEFIESRPPATLPQEFEVDITEIISDGAQNATVNITNSGEDALNFEAYAYYPNPVAKNAINQAVIPVNNKEVKTIVISSPSVNKLPKPIEFRDAKDTDLTNLIGNATSNLGWSAEVSAHAVSLFDHTTVADYVGMEVSNIVIFSGYQTLGSSFVEVWEGYNSTIGGPSDVIASQEFVPAIYGQEIVTLTSPAFVNGKDLWVGWYFTQPAQSGPGTQDYCLAMDEGPAAVDKNYIRTGVSWSAENEYGNFGIVATLTGTAIPTWLNIDVTSGSIAGSATQTINLSFDLTGLSSGTHTCTFVVESNDVDEAWYEIPVTLEVPASVNGTASAAVMTFPNPANTELNIVSETVVGQVTFTNIAGQTVKTVKVNGKSAKISLENLNAGLYFVNINTENSTITQKVIVK